MKLNMRKTIFVIIIFVFVLAFFRTTSFAEDRITTDLYRTNLTVEDTTYLFSKSAGVIKILRNIAVIVSILGITIIGIRYMAGSVEERSEYKETMYPLVVGCILIGTVPFMIEMILSIFNW